MGELASGSQLRWGFARIALVTVPLVMLLGSLSGRLAGSGEDNVWFAALTKPAIYPPGWVFGLVWTLLYILMGVALAIILHARGARLRRLAISAFVVQLLLNLAWSPLFFGLHRIGASFALILALLVTAVVTTGLFGRIRATAAWLMLPYLLWLGFAAVLCWRVWQLNPDALAPTAAPVVEMQLPQ